MAACCGLVACGGREPVPDSNPGGPLPAFMAAEIESGEDGRCFGRDITPAVIETVTAQVLDRPAVTGPDGEVLVPAVYRSDIRQEIAREREEVLFETMCPPAFTHDFVASLQRALSARGFYQGAITGILDAQTGRAVQDFQREGGPDSPLLSIDAARTLGLVTLSGTQFDLLNGGPSGER